MLTVQDFSDSIKANPRRVYQLIREGFIDCAVYRDNNGKPYIDPTKLNDHHLLSLQFNPCNDIKVFCETCDDDDEDAFLHIPTNSTNPFVTIDHHVHLGVATVVVPVMIRLTADLMNALNTRWSDIQIGVIDPRD